MSDTVKLISPVDGSIYAERSTASDAEIQSAIKRANAAQAEWVNVPIAERGRYCKAMLEAMVAMSDEVVPELAWQMGRPVRFGGEFGPFADRVNYMTGIAEEALSPLMVEDSGSFRRYVKRDPLGIVFVIAPWNYPYITAVNTIVPALMAGSAVILKHAAQTLLVGERFQMAFDKAGLPAGLFQNIVLSHAQTEALLGSGAIDHCNFTGSVAGGKDPAYVRADAKLDHAIENLVDGAYYNSGQCCCGIERVYVDEKVYDDFVEGFADLARGYVLGSPLEEATTLGPMAQTKGADFVRQQVAEAVRDGATAHVDTSKFEMDKPGSPYIAPQVLTNVNHQMSVMREESFGPVVGIMKVKDEAEAIHLMNDSPYGLTASVWTTDVEAAARIGEKIETGTVYMNRCDYLDPALVWTGVKDTGRGAALSRIGYEVLTRPKSFHLRIAV